MAITYPRELPSYHLSECWFELDENVSSSVTFGNMINLSQVMPESWRVNVVTGLLYPYQQAEWAAWKRSLKGGLRYFLAYDLKRKYPLAYPDGYAISIVPTGEISISGNVLTNTYARNGNSVSFDQITTFTRSSDGTYFDNAGKMQAIGNNVPRFDHMPETGIARGMLIEPTRTNLIMNSGLSGAGTNVAPTNWTLLNVTAGNFEVVSSIYGDNQTAIRFSNTVASTRYFIQRAFNVEPNTTYTVSFYLENDVATNSGGIMTLLGDGYGYNVATPNTKGRKTLTFTSPASGGSIVLRLGIGTAAIANGDNSVILSRPQVEQGSNASSFIDTPVSTAGTRASENLQLMNAGLNNWEIVLETTTQNFPNVDGNLTLAAAPERRLRSFEAERLLPTPTWPQTATVTSLGLSGQLGLSGLPQGYRFTAGDRVGLEQNGYYGYHEIMEDATVAANGTITVEVSPFLETSVFTTAAVARIFQPKAKFIIDWQSWSEPGRNVPSVISFQGYQRL